VRIGARLRVARDRHPAVATSPKAVRRSRGRGCHGHRILGRALTDGRRSGSSRGDGFHEPAFRMVLAVFRILRPVRAPTRRRPARLQPRGSQGRREGEREIATGASEARSRQRRGDKTPTLAATRGQALDVDPPKRSSDVVKRPVPRSCRAEPESPWGVPAAQAVERAGNVRGAGARSSIGWQTSVGRIERLPRRAVARSIGPGGR